MRRRPAAALLLAAVAALAAGACSSGPPAPVSIGGAVANKGTRDVTAQGGAATATVQMGDDWFSPSFVKLAPGASVTVTVSEVGDVAHTFTIDGQRVDVALSRKGESKTVVVTGPNDGQPVVFYCKYHRSAGMQGAFYTSP